MHFQKLPQRRITRKQETSGIPGLPEYHVRPTPGPKSPKGFTKNYPSRELRESISKSTEVSWALQNRGKPPQSTIQGFRQAHRAVKAFPEITPAENYEKG